MLCSIFYVILTTYISKISVGFIFNPIFYLNWGICMLLYKRTSTWIQKYWFLSPHSLLCIAFLLMATKKENKSKTVLFPEKKTIEMFISWYRIIYIKTRGYNDTIIVYIDTIYINTRYRYDGNVTSSDNICWLNKITIENKFTFVNIHVTRFIMHKKNDKRRLCFQSLQSAGKAWTTNLSKYLSNSSGHCSDDA